MMRMLLSFFLLLFLTIASYAFEPFVQYHTKDLKQAACYPSGAARGLMYPGEKPSFVLYLKNGTAQTQDLRVETLVKDYQGKMFAKLPPLQLKLPAAKEAQTTFEVPASKEPNYYILYMEIFSGKKKITSLQSAFSCVTPYPGKRDPFFGLDKYGVNGAMIQAYQRLGAGSAGICIGRKVTDDPDKVIPRRKRGIDWKNLLNSDLEIVGALWPTVYYDKRVKQRVDQGLPALCDDEVLHYKKYVRRLVTELKDKVKVWMVMSEYDGAFQNPSITYHSSTAVLANHVLLTRIAYREIKKIQPEAKVAVLGMMGLDYYRVTPKYRITRLILDDLKKDYDLLCIDAYNGNWHSLRGPLNLPENDFRNFLKDTADLSASYGRPRTVINAENGYSYDFRAGYNDKTLYQIACFTARRLVINRSVPCLFNFWHKASHPSVAAKIDSGLTRSDVPVKDLAVFWKTIHSGVKRKYVEVPLLPGAAYATAARCLAYVTPSEEIRLGTDIYCYTFTNAKNQSIAALWSIREPVKIELDLPAETLKTDMVGRTAKLPAGKNEILLTQEVVYLALPTAKCPVKTLNGVIRTGKTSFPIPVQGSGYMTGKNTALVFLKNRDNSLRKVQLLLNGKSREVSLKAQEVKTLSLPVGDKVNMVLIQPDGKKVSFPFNDHLTPVTRISKPVFNGSGDWFRKLTGGKLFVPEHVYPKEALTPEWGLFKMDGSDIQAEYAFGYDDENLYFGVRVKDAIHSQRHTRYAIWKGDMVHFAFTKRNALPERIRHNADKSAMLGSSDFCAGLALTEKGTQVYAYQNGKAPQGSVRWDAKVTRKGTETLYEIAIPLAKLGIKPEKGSSLRFGFVVMDHNRISDSSPKYHLAFSRGIAGGQDVSKFNTLFFR